MSVFVKCFQALAPKRLRAPENRCVLQNVAIGKHSIKIRFV